MEDEISPERNDVFQILPSHAHMVALWAIQPIFIREPSWLYRLLGWRYCLDCKGYGHRTILSKEALENKGEDVLRWAQWTSFLPPIQIEEIIPCPKCNGLGRIKPTHRQR